MIKRVNWLGGSTLRQVLWGNEGKVGSPRVARRMTLLPWTTFLHIKGAFRFPLIFRSEKLFLWQCTYRSSVRYFFTQAATSWSCSEEKKGCKVEMFDSVNLWNLYSANVVWFSGSLRKHRHFTTLPLKSRGKIVDLLQVDLTSFLASGARFLGREAASDEVAKSGEGLFWKSRKPVVVSRNVC